MKINASWLRMCIEMHRRHQIPGGMSLALGTPDVMLSHSIAEGLFRERGFQFVSIPSEKRTCQLSVLQKQLTQDPCHFMTARDLCAMMGYESLETLHTDESADPDMVIDIGKPVPKSLHNKYDLIFNAGLLERTADVFQAQENIGNMMKPGGWVILYTPMAGAVNAPMYFTNPPFYFDTFSANGLNNFDAWINWVPDWDEQNDIRTIWLNFKYNDDVHIWRPPFSTMMWFMAQKERFVGDFQTVLQNFYKEWHAGQKLFATTEDELLTNSGLSDLAVSSANRANRSEFARDALAGLSGDDAGQMRSPWKHPTAMSIPTAEQVARFPLDDIGVPHASECLLAPANSATAPEIPEQMAVGSPRREQLYL